MKIAPTRDGMRVEVRDPGEPAEDGEGPEWAEVSTLATSWGGSRTAAGHFAWAEITEAAREELAGVASASADWRARQGAEDAMTGP